MSTTIEASTLYADVVAALGDLSEIVADETADAGTYSYRYAPLSTIMRTIRPVLAQHHLAVSQLVSSTGGELTVSTALVHVSGESFPSGALSVAQPKTPQQLGSLVSYLRRYQLVALLGLAVEDDDGKSAQTPSRPAGASRGTSGSDLSDAQRRTIMALFTQLDLSGPANRDERLELTSEIIGRSIVSTNEVTKDEAGVLIDELSARTDEMHSGDYS